MATYRLKSKTYSAPKVYHLQRIYAESEQPEKKGLSTGAKVGLGVAGTALTAGGALLGARSGFFGAKAMKAANTMIKNAGTTLKGKGDGKGLISGLGKKMETSGAYREGVANRFLNAKNLQQAQVKNLANKTNYKNSEQYRRKMEAKANSLKTPTERGMGGVNQAGAGSGGFRNVGRS